MRISYVVPVHDQEAVLETTVTRLRARLAERPGSEVVLVENGSHDRSAEICARLAAPAGSPVRVVATRSAKGLGHALRHGMRIAGGDLVVLTAADLPFGFSDLDAWLALDSPPPLVIGSKAHAASQVSVGVSRRVMSSGFRVLRQALLGLGARDTQGTLLMSRRLVRGVLPHLLCDDFLITTEIVAWAQERGHIALEVPVRYVAGGASTVSPLADSVHMAVGLLALRRRLAHGGRLTPEPA